MTDFYVNISGYRSKRQKVNGWCVDFRLWL